MTSIQRVPVIEEVTLSDTDDELPNPQDVNPHEAKIFYKNVNGNSRKFSNNFPSQTIKSTIEQVYLQGDFEVFDVPDSSDDDDKEAVIINLKVNSQSNKNVASIHFMDHDGSIETDDDQFYIDDDVRDSNNKPVDLSLAREDERLSSISSTVISLSSKSDKDKLNSASSGKDVRKNSSPAIVMAVDEEKFDNEFKEDIDPNNMSSGDDLDITGGTVHEITMPSRDDKHFRVRGKSYVETICNYCHYERRMAGKLWQNKVCRYCNENLQFQCAKCKKRFASYHSTLCHLKKECLSQNFWSCSQCSYSVMDEKKLEEHMKKAHLNRKLKKTKKKQQPKTDAFYCHECNLAFKWKATFERHYCRRQEIYRCQMCDYTSSSRNLVKRHFTNSHVKDTRPICVPDITSSSNNVNETKRKTDEETRAEDERLNKSILLHCQKCSQNFKYTGEHVKKCETCDNSLLWQCAACKELSKSYCGIYAHLQSCTDMLQGCEKCQKKFESQDDLEKHRHVCGEDLYLQCELCDYKTRTKGLFLKHVKVKHNLQSDDIRKWL